MASDNVKDILKKYGNKIKGEISTIDLSNYSSDYKKFKQEMYPRYTRYESFCKKFGNFIHLKISEKEKAKIQKFLDIAHLDIEPWQAVSLAFFSFFVVFFIGALLSVIFFIYDLASIGQIFSFFLFFVLLSSFIFYFLYGYPERAANSWRLKASSQMVPAILYTVIYMRHTSNLEKAIAFAAENLQPPLAIDFKKIIYDVEIGKYSNISDSLLSYLELWRDYFPEVIEAFHLIESSLFQTSNSQKTAALEKALQVVLDGVYNKMLVFSREVRGPITNTYMFGVVLPTLTLSMLPIVSTFLSDIFRWYHLFFLFNLIVPFAVLYFSDKILLSRPGGYGETSLLELNPYYPKYRSKKPYFISFLIVLPLLLIGFLPLIFHYTSFPSLVGLKEDYSFGELGLSFFGEKEMLFDFRNNNGPFGLFAVILSLFVPLSIALFFSISFSMKTKDLIKYRNQTKELEEEFSSSLFQLGNRLGEGIPPEIVFSRVAEVTKGQKTSNFFYQVNYNIQRNGLSVERAIFDPKVGAIINFPSDLVSISMKIFVESIKKGLKIAAISMISISEYIQNLQKINLRLKDLLAEVISDMKSNIVFMTPFLTAIVVSLSVMITTIISKISDMLAIGEGLSSFGNFSNLLSVLGDFSKMIPPYFLQISIGVYVIEVILILTRTLVAIDSGEDKLERTHQSAQNLKYGISFYFFISLVGIIALYFLTRLVLQGFGA